MNTTARAGVALDEQAQHLALTHLTLQELETRLVDLPERERRQLIDRAIRTRQAEERRQCDAALRDLERRTRSKGASR